MTTVRPIELGGVIETRDDVVAVIEESLAHALASLTEPGGALSDEARRRLSPACAAAIEELRAAREALAAHGHRCQVQSTQIDESRRSA